MHEQEEDDEMRPAKGSLDVAVLIEGELGSAAARRLIEAVVVADRRRPAALLRRDLPSQVRARVQLPTIHLVSS